MLIYKHFVLPHLAEAITFKFHYHPCQEDHFPLSDCNRGTPSVGEDKFIYAVAAFCICRVGNCIFVAQGQFAQYRKPILQTYPKSVKVYNPTHRCSKCFWTQLSHVPCHFILRHWGKARNGFVAVGAVIHECQASWLKKSDLFEKLNARLSTYLAFHQHNWMLLAPDLRLLSWAQEAKEFVRSTGYTPHHRALCLPQSSSVDPQDNRIPLLWQDVCSERGPTFAGSPCTCQTQCSVGPVGSLHTHGLPAFCSDFPLKLEHCAHTPEREKREKREGGGRSWVQGYFFFYNVPTTINN